MAVRVECLNCGALDAPVQCDLRRYCSKECALQKEREAYSMEIKKSLTGLAEAIQYSRTMVKEIESGDRVMKPGCTESLEDNLRVQKKLIKIQSMIVRMFALLLDRNCLYFRFKAKFLEESCDLLEVSPTDRFAVEMGQMMMYVHGLLKKDGYFLTAR